MKGKFSHETAERLYADWSEGLANDECQYNDNAYALFVDGEWACIISEDNQGFVDFWELGSTEAAAEWQRILSESDDWHEAEISDLV